MRFPRVRRTVATVLATGFALALVATAAPAQAAEPSQSGGDVGPQIIGGTEVPNGAYPFMAALLEKGPGSPFDRQGCGGTLIRPTTILTAAHCVDDPAALEVVVGRTVLSDTTQGEVRNVASVLTHPLYGQQPGYDIALLELEAPVTGVRPIQLPTRGTDGLIRPGSTATVVGWGSTDTGMPYYPDRLRQVDVPLLSHNECEIAYPKNDPEMGNDAYERLTDICAGVEGKDSCKGDSGGPIFRAVPGTQTFIQIGIVSRGEGCAEQGGPGIYTYTGSKALMEWETMGNALAAQG